MFECWLVNGQWISDESFDRLITYDHHRLAPWRRFRRFVTGAQAQRAMEIAEARMDLVWQSSEALLGRSRKE